MPEVRIYNHLLKQESKEDTKENVKKIFGKQFKMGQQNGIKKLFNLKDGKLTAIEQSSDFTDIDQDILKQMKEGEFFDGSYEKLSQNDRVKKLKKRKLYSVKNQIYYTIQKADGFCAKVKVLRFDLTMEDIV